MAELQASGAYRAGAYRKKASIPNLVRRKCFPIYLSNDDSTQAHRQGYTVTLSYTYTHSHTPTPTHTYIEPDTHRQTHTHTQVNKQLWNRKCLGDLHTTTVSPMCGEKSWK